MFANSYGIDGNGFYFMNNGFRYLDFVKNINNSNNNIIFTNNNNNLVTSNINLNNNNNINVNRLPAVSTST
jgi:hypothetical protein